MMKNVIEFIGEDPSEKPYLILLTIYAPSSDENIDDTKEWCIKIGRQTTYDFLKNLIQNEIINPVASFIIAAELKNADSSPSLRLSSDAVSVFQFMKTMFEQNKVLNDPEEFCIDDYAQEKIVSILDI